MIFARRWVSKASSVDVASVAKSSISESETVISEGTELFFLIAVITVYRDPAHDGGEKGAESLGLGWGHGIPRADVGVVQTFL